MDSKATLKKTASEAWPPLSLRSDADVLAGFRSALAAILLRAAFALSVVPAVCGFSASSARPLS